MQGAHEAEVMLPALSYFTGCELKTSDQKYFGVLTPFPSTEIPGLCLLVVLQQNL